MAVPKKRTSVARKGKRRAGQHHKLYATTFNRCSNCGDMTMPHRACPSCGHYSGKEIIKMPVEATETDNAGAVDTAPQV